jgi:hypothetical protein
LEELNGNGSQSAKTANHWICGISIDSWNWQIKLTKWHRQIQLDSFNHTNCQTDKSNHVALIPKAN